MPATLTRTLVIGAAASALGNTQIGRYVDITGTTDAQGGGYLGIYRDAIYATEANGVLERKVVLVAGSASPTSNTKIARFIDITGTTDTEGGGYLGERREAVNATMMSGDAVPPTVNSVPFQSRPVRIRTLLRM